MKRSQPASPKPAKRTPRRECDPLDRYIEEKRNQFNRTIPAAEIERILADVVNDCDDLTELAEQQSLYLLDDILVDQLADLSDFNLERIEQNGQSELAQLAKQSKR